LIKKILVILCVIGLSSFGFGSATTIVYPLQQTITPLGNTIIVDDEGDGDVVSITEALDIAVSGDIIQVYSGTYEQNLVISTNNIFLEGISYELGAGGDESNPIIQGEENGDVIRIEATNVTITGFIVQQSGRQLIDAGISIYADDNHVVGNGILSNFYGIIVNNCSNTEITGNYIVSNVMDGIYLLYTSNNLVSNNVITENGFQGMFLYDTSNNLISENNITRNGKDGIQLRNYCSQITIKENNLEMNNIDGIKIMESQVSNVLITKNTIISNRWNGIHLMNGNHNEIHENQITSNLWDGIHIGNADENIIQKNTIKNNYDHGIDFLFDGCENNIIYHNNIINDAASDNGNNQWDNGPDAGGNYWSYYNGKDENNDGIGDTPFSIPGSGNEDRYPFMMPLQPPEKPQTPTGNTFGAVGTSYIYSTRSTDANRNTIQYGWDWNDDRIIDKWTPFYTSGEFCNLSIQWETEGTYLIRVIAMDNHGFQSEWSDPLAVTMPKNLINEHMFTLRTILQRITILLHRS